MNRVDKNWLGIGVVTSIALLAILGAWLVQSWRADQALLSEARRQAQTLAALERMGAYAYSEVNYDPDSYPKAGFGIGGSGGNVGAPDWLKAALDSRPFYEPRLLSVGRERRHSVAEWNYFAALPDLRAVNDQGGVVDDRAIAILSRVSGLEYLNCDGPVTDQGLNTLASMPSLRILAINRAEGTTASGIAQLASLPRLERLQVFGSQATAAEVLGIAPQFPHLRRLELYSPRMTQAEVAQLRAQLPGTIVNSGSPPTIAASSPASP